MFPTRTLLKLLAVLEEDIQANHVAVGAFHLWPALRFLLATRLQDNDQSKAPAAPVVAAEADIERRFERLTAARPPRPDLSPAALERIPLVRRGPTGQGLLLISRGEDHSLKTPRGFYAPVIDPWADLAAGRWACVKAELVGGKFNETQPRAVMTLAAMAAGAAPSATDVAERDAVLRSAKVLAATAGKWLETELGLALPQLGEVFARELHALWSDRLVYRDLLRQVNPALVITSCYYFRPTLGVVWAARELGIAVADAQHGGNGEYHIGYTHWRNVPEGGYLLLPDHFLVWDNISANNVLRWLPTGCATPQAPIAGRFGLGRATAAMLGDGPSPVTALTAGGEKTVLVTLQTLPSTGLTPLILEVMRRAPKTWTWLVRGHPIAQAFGGADVRPEALEQKLKDAGIARADARLATSLPLGALLPHVDHHLTGFSGTVQESAAYGVRTTFTHPTYSSFFAKFVEIGAADYAPTPEAALASIAAAPPFPDLSAILRMPRDDATARSVLEGLIG